jgi:methionyl-tRNA formyltransferase
MEGAKESGISIFQPDEGVDTGPLYLQKRGVPIEATDTMASLYFDKLYPMGVEAMVETVAAIDAGSARLEPQGGEGASFQGLVNDEAARLNFGLSLDQLDQRIRGCDPSPGAWAQLGEEPVRLFGCGIAGRQDSGEAPGTVLGVDESGLRLAAVGGVLCLQKVRRAAGKVSATDSGLRPGDRLA